MSAQGVQYYSNNNSIVINTTDRTYYRILEVKLVSRFTEHLPGKTFNTTIFRINIGHCDDNYMFTNLISNK